MLIPIVLLSLGAPAAAADPPLSQDQAIALLHDGKRPDALHAFEAIIAANPPDPSTALFYIGAIELEDGDWQSARPYVQRLVKLRPASFQAWELMIQLDQAAGALDDRDAAIQSLYDAWHSALDRQTRSRVSFVRDRIVGAKHTLIGQQTLETGGDDILRFLFAPAGETNPAHHLIVVRADNDTNERWREDGTVPYGTVVYHLDTIEQLPNGQASVRPYEYYLQPPDYDRIRPKVVGILAGTVQPLSGTADPFWAGAPAR
jgi:tetratricopeptide (TPR) repeat protein